MYEMRQSDQETSKPRRKDAGVLQTTERDILVLTWTAEQFCIPFDQLQQLLGRHAKATTKDANKLSISATREAISRWLQLGFIEEPRKIISGHPPYIWLSRRGLAQLGLPYAYYKPQISSVKHIYAVNAIRLHFERQELQASWYPERAITRGTTPPPTPDAELSIPGQSPTAIKILERPIFHDITVQDEITALQALAKRYAAIWYFTPCDNLSRIQQALTKTHQQVQQIITFYGLNAEPVTNA